MRRPSQLLDSDSTPVGLRQSRRIELNDTAAGPRRWRLRYPAQNSRERLGGAKPRYPTRCRLIRVNQYYGHVLPSGAFLNPMLGALDMRLRIGRADAHDLGLPHRQLFEGFLD